MVCKCTNNLFWEREKNRSNRCALVEISHIPGIIVHKLPMRVIPSKIH